MVPESAAPPVIAPIKKGARSGLPQKGRAEVYVCEVGFRQRAVGQVETFKARGPRFVLDVVLETSFDVPEFTSRCIGWYRLIGTW